MIIIYFENLGFGSFIISAPDFIQSVLSRSCRSSAAHPLRSNDHYLLWESKLRSFQHLNSQFNPERFLPKSQIKRHYSFQIGRSLFTLEIRASGVSSSQLSFSSAMFYPEVTNQVPCILSYRTIIIYFGNLGFGVFNISTYGFIWSILSWSRRSSATHSSPSDGQYLLQESWLQEFQHLDSWFHPELFLLEMQIKCHTSFQIRRSLFTLGI